MNFESSSSTSSSSAAAAASTSYAGNSRKRIIPTPSDPSNRKRNPRNVLSRGLGRKSPFTDIGSYMEVKNRKLQAQFEADASTSALGGGGGQTGIFHGISIFVDGFTVPSSQELKGYMLKHGGHFENYFSRHRVTHIICSHLPDRKLRNLRAFSRGLPVLKPAWLVDSVAANKLLNWVPYQLEDLVNETCKQQKLSSFFGLRDTSSLKINEIPIEPHVKFDTECSLPKDEKLKNLLLQEEGESSKSERQSTDSSREIACPGHEIFCHERNTELKFTDLEGENSIMEADEYSPRRPSNNVDSFSIEKENFKESLDLKHPEACSQQHSIHGNHLDVGNNFKATNHQIQSASCLRSKYVHINTSAGADHDLMPSSLSQVDVSVLQQLPEDLKVDILESLPSHRESSCFGDASRDSVRKYSCALRNQNSENSNVHLWLGTPPNWVGKFKLSNCLMLNVIAQLYSKSGTEALLSVILQSLISYIPPTFDSSEDGWDEALSSFCKLLTQYIEFKIESDIEELYICFRLLKRFAATSIFLSQAYNIALPFLQTFLAINVLFQSLQFLQTNTMILTSPLPKPPVRLI